MDVIEFFEYLAAYPATRRLAHELADVWVTHQLRDLFASAA